MNKYERKQVEIIAQNMAKTVADLVAETFKDSATKVETQKPISTIKEKTFIVLIGNRVTTTDKADIKMMKACGWREVKSTKQYFAKGLKDGRNFLD